MEIQTEERVETIGAVAIQTGIDPLVLHFGPLIEKLSDDDFFDFFRLNEELRLELTGEGDLLIMPPTGGKTGRRNFKLTSRFGNWVEQDGTGQGFDSSTIFTLPNGAKRSPDLAWVHNERWGALTEEQQEKFPPLCPDFVAEIRSRTDRLKVLQEKMQEYVENGAQLGWLLDPLEWKVYVYRPQTEVEILDNPQTLSGDPVLSGLTLNVPEIWD
ncbi:MAG: Uma2 family endonuclease [Pyrinomonadaceae bacterium]